jgi:hypothetical protein
MINYKQCDLITVALSHSSILLSVPQSVLVRQRKKNFDPIKESPKECGVRQGEGEWRQQSTTIGNFF